MSKYIKLLTADIAFFLYQSHGLPIEITELMAEKKGIKIDPNIETEFEKLMDNHRQKSKNDKFKK